MTFTANRHMTGKALEVVYDRMRAAVEAGLLKSGRQARDYAPSLPKDCILSMQGRWNSRLI